MVITIGERTISTNTPCFIIAEAGVNHILNPEDLQRAQATSPLEVAYKMVDAAHAAGADAIKFQTFSAEKLQFKGTEKPKYQVDNLGSDNTISYFDLLKKLETSKEDQQRIADYCKQKGILFLSTPYDNESVDFLHTQLNIPAFKLASIELNNHLFVRKVAQTGKPIILSTGLSSLANVRTVVTNARRERFANRLVLLQCTTNYPTQPHDVHLNVLKTYQKEFPDILVGLSDHTPGVIASVGAVALGATVLEKHFTLDTTFAGPDHSASLNPQQLTQWISSIRELETSMGSYEKIVTPVEKQNESMRKYLVLHPQKAGTIITESMLTTMRTGTGILPVDQNLNQIIGRTLAVDVQEATPLTWDMIQKVPEAIIKAENSQENFKNNELTRL